MPDVGRNPEGYAIGKTGIDLSIPSGLFVEGWIYEYGLLDEFAINAYWARQYAELLSASLRVLGQDKISADDRARIVKNAEFASRQLVERPKLGGDVENERANQNAPVSAENRAFDVLAVRVPGNIHTAAVAELEETVVSGLRRLGYDAHLVSDVPEAVSCIIAIGLGAAAARLPTTAIIYNTEHTSLISTWPPERREVLRRYEIWDYSRDNAERLADMLKKEVKYVPLGFVPELARIGKGGAKDIDVLFYGSHHPRRATILEALRAAGLSVHHEFGVYGAERDALISRARLVLNIHFYEPGAFEAVRVCYLMANSKAIVTECNPGEFLDADLADGLVAVPYDGLVAACTSLIKDDERRQNLEERAFAAFSAREEAEILRGVIRPTGIIDAPTGKPATENYYTGLNAKLLSALPTASQILEIGCAVGILGARFKADHPEAHWCGVDVDAGALSVAATRLDGAYLRDLNREPLGDVGVGYDCVVIGDALEHITRPEDLLFALKTVTVPDAQLVLCVPNSAHISIVERLLCGDLAYEPSGLMDRTHVRIFSQSSLFKLLLDSGWWPEVVDRYIVGHGDPGLIEELVTTARRLGVSADTSRRTLQSYQLIVNCRKVPPRYASVESAPFSVVVPVNNEPVFALNVMASPGLHEIGADIVPCRGHASAASAFRDGVERAHHDWVVFCHQDVYFPRGSGAALERVLGSIPHAQRTRTVIGFAGLGLDTDGREFHAGIVLDRFRRYDWPAAETAISLDEFAIVLARDTELTIDEDLGWHLWATDLCLQANLQRFPPARIEHLLLFHNSLSDFVLPEAYHVSAKKLAAKYSHVPRIRSLCGVIKDGHSPASSDPVGPPNQDGDALAGLSI